MNLSGNYALVTGGGTGIGLGVALELANAGAEVTICGRRQKALDEAVASNRSLALNAEVLDVTDRDAVNALFARLDEAGRSPSILVNSAGMNIRTRSMAEMAPEQWDRVLAVNTTGTYNCTYAVLPAMRRAKAGLIVNISSVAGKRALPMAGIAYAASKFATTAFGTGVGLEEAKNGIRVSNVYPGEVDTPILDERPEPVPSERRARMVKPGDIGRLVRLMAELPEAAHIPEVVIKPLYQEYM